MTALSSFQAFLTCSQLLNSLDRSAAVFGDLPVRVSWTAWMDPGVHTGFAMVLYATPGMAQQQEVGLDKIAHHYNSVMRKVHLRGFPWTDPAMCGAAGQDNADLCSAALLAVHTELLTDSEIGQVRTAVSRIRRMGAMFAGGSAWDNFFETPEGEGPGIGRAGVGAESFINLRSERDRDYLSPVRVRSMFAYALEEEFGIEMDSQQPGDAKSAFSDIRTKRAGLYIPGPDHVRDALAHCLLAIRRNG